MKNLISFLLFCFAALTASGQFIVGNPSWKWDTIVTFNQDNSAYERNSQQCDVNGNILQQLVESRDGNSWKNYYRTLMDYENGVMKGATSSVWTGSTWMDARRITASYDLSHRIITEIIETKNLSNWTNNKRRNYGYDAMGRKSQMLQETWKNNAWINDMVNDYEYNGQGHLYRITSKLSESGGPWENLMRLTYSSDSEGNYLECIVENFEPGYWLIIGRFTYTHDSDGNILTEVMSSGDGNSWTDDMRITYTYDDHNNGVTGISEAFNGTAWTPNEGASYIYYGQDYLVVFLHYCHRWEASYKHFPLGLEDVSAEKFRIFPNPASNFFTIELPAKNININNILMYNSSGELVKALEGSSGQVVVDISDLPGGMYILREQVNGQIHSNKLFIVNP